MVGKRECVLIHYATVFEYFSANGSIMDEEMVQCAGGTVWPLAVTFSRKTGRRTLMVPVVVVSEHGSGFVARDISLIYQLLYRNRILLTVHVSHKEDRAVIFSLDYLCLRHHKTDLGGAGHGTAWLVLLRLPPQVCVEYGKNLPGPMVTEDCGSERLST